MRFSVEPKDFFLFLLYSILLMYLCAIAVLNLSSLANDGTFFGLVLVKNNLFFTNISQNA